MSSKFDRKYTEPEELSWLVALFYSWIPARMFQPTYQQIVGTLPLKNKGFLIDIGTGPGDLVQLIAKKYPNLKVIGIDLSETMIRIANKKKKNSLNLEFKVMDGKNLGFKENSIDYIISTFTFHHWRKPLKVLNEIHRVLKKRGQVFIYDIYSEMSDRDIERGLKYHAGLKIIKTFFKKTLSLHGFLKKEYENYVKNLISKSNFKKASFEQVGITMKIELRKD